MALPAWQARVTRDLRSFYAFSQRRWRRKEVEALIRAKRQNLSQIQAYLRQHPGSWRLTHEAESAQRDIARLEALRDELANWSD